MDETWSGDPAVLTAVVELCAALISKHTREGLSAARVRGHKGGYKSKLSDRPTIYRALSEQTVETVSA